jgi:GT2 family glycosyltransferase
VPTLGIVIPTLDRADVLRRALAHLGRQRGMLDEFEVVVVHSKAADADALEEALARQPYAARRLLSPRADASSQRNLGWRALTTRLVLFMGEDILASPTLVTAHLEAHARWRQAEVGVLGRVRWAGRPRPTVFMRWLEHGIQFDFRGLGPGAEAGWWRFYTANVSVKREMLERVGGFDAERFPFLYEDLDLAARMAEHGFSLRYHPDALAEHLHPQSLADWRQRVRLIAAAERRFCERHPHAKPYFHDVFAEALASGQASGRGALLAGLVSPRMPWIGGRVWASVDMWNRQQLAPEFMTAWDAADAGFDPKASDLPVSAGPRP